MTQDSSPGSTPDTLISSATSLEEILTILAQRGCADLTSSINLDECSKRPVAGGGFCDVFQGELYNRTRVAIKSLRVYDRPGGEDDKQKILKRAAREIYHWSKLDQPNVLPLAGLAIFRGNISMISEWMDNGDLMSYIRLHPEVDRMSLCVGICEGLCYIHTRGMAHGDLKSANIMVSRSGVPQIADFGNSQLKRDLTLKFTNTTNRSHSVRWTAPELLRDEDGPYTSKEADVYAYGMTVFEVITGEIPFDRVNESRLIFLVVYENRLPTRPDGVISDDLWGVLVRCWAQEPTERPTIASVRDQVRALTSDPFHSSTAESMADEADKGKPEPAIELDIPTRAEIIKNRGNEFYKMGQYDLAAENYSEAIALNPNEPTYLTNRAAAYMALRKFAPALADCQTAASLQSASPAPKTLLRLARCHLALGDTHACLAMLRNLPDSTADVSDVRRRAERLESHLRRFEDAREKDEWGEAELALKQAAGALEGDDIPVQWMCWRAECEVAGGNWTVAQASVDHALRLAPNSPDALELRGLIMFLTNQIPKAIQHAQQALRLDPDHKSARQLLKRAKEVERIKEEGNKFFEAGQPGPAVERYGEALEAVGQRMSEGGGGHLRALLLNDRAMARLQLKQLKQALEDANVSLTLDSDSYEALRTRARIHIELERYEDSIRDFKAAYEYAEAKAIGQGELRSLTQGLKYAEARLRRREEDYDKMFTPTRAFTDAEVLEAYRGSEYEENLNPASEVHPVTSYPEQQQPHHVNAYEDGQTHTWDPESLTHKRVRFVEPLLRMPGGQGGYDGFGGIPSDGQY